MEIRRMPALNLILLLVMVAVEPATPLHWALQLQWHW